MSTNTDKLSKSQWKCVTREGSHRAIYATLWGRAECGHRTKRMNIEYTWFDEKNNLQLQIYENSSPDSKTLKKLKKWQEVGKKLPCRHQSSKRQTRASTASMGSGDRESLFPHWRNPELSKTPIRRSTVPLALQPSLSYY